MKILIGAFLHALHDKKVFPELSHVIAAVELVERGNNSVPDAIVEKIVFSLFHNFTPQVPAEASDPFDNKRLLEYVEVAVDRLDVELDLGGDLIEGNLVGPLERRGA